MKKILLSSIIMLGVCGAVNAQSETSSRVKKTDAAATSTSAAAPALTPQKSSVTPASDVLAPVTRTPADKAAGANAPAPAPQTKAEKFKAAQAPAAVTVNSAGEIVPSEEAKLQAVKAAETKATGANEKKNQQ